MRRTALVALALACTTLYGDDYWCLNQHVTFLAEYTFLNRTDIRDFTLVRKTKLQGIDQRRRGKKLLDTEDVVECFGAESGFRGGIIFHINACSSLEALYTYVLPWHACSKVSGVGNLNFPFHHKKVINGFVNADKVEAKYKSWFQNGEVNYWIHATPQYVNYFSFSYGMGFRTIFLREKFNLDFTKVTGEATSEAKTWNALYGGQFGAMLEINPNHCWTWSLLVKGAGFIDDAKNEVSVHDPSSDFPLPHRSKSQTVACCLIEGYAQLAYHWTSFFDMHVGYQGFLLSGVALAPEQRVLSFREKCGLIHGGEAIIHGAYAGLTLSF